MGRTFNYTMFLFLKKMTFPSLFSVTENDLKKSVKDYSVAHDSSSLISLFLHRIICQGENVPTQSVRVQHHKTVDRFYSSQPHFLLEKELLNFFLCDRLLESLSQVNSFFV